VRSFEDVVEQIRASILTGTLPIGERLPSERELAEMFGVSRPTLREALRALEAVGLLDIRLGSQGGAFAGSGDGQASASAISGVLASHAAGRADQLIGLRASHHADNAYWATPEGVAQLEDGGEFLVALAAATGNQLRVLLTKAIELSITEAQLPVVGLDPATQAEVAARIRRHDRDGARDLVHQVLSRPAAEDASVA
jgi:DNA-binding FadR family transcriptional regulator